MLDVCPAMDDRWNASHQPKSNTLVASSSGPRPLPDCKSQRGGDERICETQDCQVGGRGRTDLPETGVVSESMETRVAQS